MSIMFLSIGLTAVSLAVIHLGWTVRRHQEDLDAHQDLLFQLCFPELQRRHPATRNRPQEEP